ncbi:Protein of unknown function (DUF4113) [Desulfocurvibacter africanus PCS]|uniref:DUF4113 domain-containing protein n=1 Tax=Desulfocurvibacter africanus PCS TaxID=1262666 RepID=M5Q0E2_DESAF|nr:DUF4113 domain-containing protein [Desulfocurvibacter africanus]EMG36626.1 Protein of unknown function (DUF4113) [Desulfocurvibacter africanus PCS]
MRLFWSGHAYQKAGVLLAGIEPKSSRQLSLIAPQPMDEAKHGKAMAVLDAASRRYGQGTLAYAGGGIEPEWGMKREKLSPAYTTRWDQLLEVRGKLTVVFKPFAVTARIAFAAFVIHQRRQRP